MVFSALILRTLLRSVLLHEPRKIPLWWQFPPKLRCLTQDGTKVVVLDQKRQPKGDKDRMKINLQKCLFCMDSQRFAKEKRQEIGCHRPLNGPF